MHVYEVRPRNDKRGVDLISNALPFGRRWYDGTEAVSNTIGYAEHYSRSHDAVMRAYDDAGKSFSQGPPTEGDILAIQTFPVTLRRILRITSVP